MRQRDETARSACDSRRRVSHVGASVRARRSGRPEAQPDGGCAVREAAQEEGWSFFGSLIFIMVRFPVFVIVSFAVVSGGARWLRRSVEARESVSRSLSLFSFHRLCYLLCQV